MLRVKKVTYLSDYKLKILFSNRIVKIVNFEKWILEGNVYLKPLKDIGFFKQVHLDESNYSICWPNGADFSPDVLYEAGETIKTKVQMRRQKNPITNKTRPSKSL